MYRNRRLDLRLTERDLALLDQARGSVTRSAYIRWLIHQAAKKTTQENTP